MPKCDPDSFEAILAGRNLFLLNEVLAATTASLVAALPRYVDNTMHRLRAYLDTGTYRLVVPGFVPLDI